MTAIVPKCVVCRTCPAIPEPKTYRILCLACASEFEAFFRSHAQTMEPERSLEFLVGWALERAFEWTASKVWREAEMVTEQAVARAKRDAMPSEGPGASRWKARRRR